MTIGITPTKKSWELECDYDFCAWKQGLLKHREKNIRAKYDEHLNKLYESGFLDFIIEKMDISYQEGSSLSIYDDVYEERNGVFYPEGHHAHDKGLSVEQILAEHAVEELLLADGTLILILWVDISYFMLRKLDIWKSKASLNSSTSRSI